MMSVISEFTQTPNYFVDQRTIEEKQPPQKVKKRNSNAFQLTFARFHASEENSKMLTLNY
jgi:hypothetical protein